MSMQPVRLLPISVDPLQAMFSLGETLPRDEFFRAYGRIMLGKLEFFFGQPIENFKLDQTILPNIEEAGAKRTYFFCDRANQAYCVQVICDGGGTPLAYKVALLDL